MSHVKPSNMSHRGYLLFLTMLGHTYYQTGNGYNKDIQEARRYPEPPYKLAERGMCKVGLYDFSTKPPRLIEVVRLDGR